MPGFRAQLNEYLRSRGRRESDIDAVILTHAHSDHVGMVEGVREDAPAEVHVHADDAEMAKTGKVHKPVGSHVLNFATGRPVWQFQDGSFVEATRKVGGTAAPGSIPPLLLQAVVTGEGPDGDRLLRTTWVQRLNTSGGVAPSAPCTPGATLAVPYTTDYLFWREQGGDDSDD